MIVEMRTYSYRPGTVPEALARIERGLPERTTLSPLGALWYTDVGRLHQIIHLWPFANLVERERVRAGFAGLKNWPARTGELMVESENIVLQAASFSPPLTPRQIGPLFEICTDVVKPNGLKRLNELWQPLIEARMALSPLVGAWTSEFGPMNRWIHIWAYRSFEHRLEVRAGAAKQGWPPPGIEDLVTRQDSVICFPANFSPIR
ncbi:MAG: NIPSNAP family protein [Pseudomonadota bacterium]